MANDVYLKSLKKVINVNDFVNLHNSAELENDISCSTKNCKARFVYHSASENKEHHFQKFPGEEHSEFCEFKTSGIAGIQNRKHSEKIKSSLDDIGYDATLNNVLKYLETIIRPDRIKKTKNKKNRKKSQMVKVNPNII